MPSPTIDTPQALDAAIEASVKSRRDALMRTARGEGFRLGEILAGIVALLACAELILEPKRAVYSALIACSTCAFVYSGRNARRKEALRKLREMDNS